MFKRISTPELVLIALALLSLIYSEVSWFQGNREEALFVGLWVPSILGFAIYLKLLKINDK